MKKIKATKIMTCNKCGHKQKVKTKTAVCSICLWPMNKVYKIKEESASIQIKRDTNNAQIVTQDSTSPVNRS